MKPLEPWIIEDLDKAREQERRRRDQQKPRIQAPRPGEKEPHPGGAKPSARPKKSDPHVEDISYE